MKNDISYLIHTVFTENQELVNLKSNLTIGLKSMKNSHDMIKYLESQKADLLLFVNDQIQENAKVLYLYYSFKIHLYNWDLGLYLIYKLLSNY